MINSKDFKSSINYSSKKNELREVIEDGIEVSGEEKVEVSLKLTPTSKTDFDSGDLDTKEEDLKRNKKNYIDTTAAGNTNSNTPLTQSTNAPLTQPVILYGSTDTVLTADANSVVNRNDDDGSKGTTAAIRIKHSVWTAA